MNQKSLPQLMESWVFKKHIKTELIAQLLQTKLTIPLNQTIMSNRANFPLEINLPEIRTIAQQSKRAGVRQPTFSQIGFLNFGIAILAH